MTTVDMVFWRSVTSADFFHVERTRAAGPKGGGGQSYFSISFAGLTYVDLGEFLSLNVPSAIGVARPDAKLKDVGVAVDPDVRADIHFKPRYQPPQVDDRYRIATQNRQFQARHPAWTADYGFPQAPDDVTGRADGRIPDLTYLRLFILRLTDGKYLAGFTNTPTPQGPLAKLRDSSPLFTPYDERNSAGVLRLSPGELDSSEFLQPGPLGTFDVDPSKSPEVHSALEETRLLAGRRPSGQGRMTNATVKRAIELRAMDVASDHYKSLGFKIDDVSANQSFDFLCTQGNQTLMVEVKGTTGNGGSVLLTPNEVMHARNNFPNVSLAVVNGIKYHYDETTDAATAWAGELKVYEPYDLDADGSLVPTGYEFRISPPKV